VCERDDYFDDKGARDAEDDSFAYTYAAAERGGCQVDFDAGSGEAAA